MTARPRTRPARALPSLQAQQLRLLVDLYDAVDLAVRVRVVLAGELGDRGHVDAGDGEEMREGGGERDFAAAVVRAFYGAAVL